MKVNTKEFSKELAKEIANRSFADIDGISILIDTRIKSSLLSLIEDCTTREEDEYIRLTAMQSKCQKGSDEYKSIGFLIHNSKMKKAIANRAINEMKREAAQESFRAYIDKTFGAQVYKDFISERKGENKLNTTK